MNNGYLYDRAKRIGWIMTALGGFGAVAAVLLRVWLSPSQRDIETGLFSTNIPTVALMLLIVALLGAGLYLVRGGFRQEITGKPSLTLSVALLAAGGVLALFGASDILVRLGVFSANTISVQSTETVTLPAMILPWLQAAFCLLGGVALFRLGLGLASEGATRRGMAQWSLLAPVLWVWLVLANYEMSYASMVRLSDGFFTLATYIMEMLFLFFFARYIAGVGKVGFGTLLFFSCSAALFAISAPLVRVIMYLLQDGEAYAAAGAAGLPDLAIGVLALTVSITLCQSLSVSASQQSRETEEDAWFSAEAKVELVEGFDENEEE